MSSQWSDDDWADLTSQPPGKTANETAKVRRMFTEIVMGAWTQAEHTEAESTQIQQYMQEVATDILADER